MKILLAVLLAASLAANALLIKNRSATTGSATAGTPAASDSSKTALTAPPLSAETWQLINAGDPSSLEKLRALGLPDEIARRIIRARVELRYREREQALIARTNYWQRNYNSARFRPSDPLKALDLRREKDAELKALLGSDYRKDDENNDPRTAFLPPAKAEELRLLQEDYEALAQSTYTYDGGIMLPEDREKLTYIEKQKRTDLAALLTPEELAAYDLRNSTTANMLSWQLRDSDFTEEEYKTIFAIRRPFDDQYSQFYGSQSVSGDQAKERQKAEDAMKKEIKAALGDERYAAYERSQDQDYKTLTKLAARLELPPEKALAAYTLKTSLEEKLKTFRPQPAQPGADPRKQYSDFIAGIAREAETGLTAILGEKGLGVYKENSILFRRLQIPISTPPKS